MNNKKKFVVLENLTQGYEGSRFWSTNNPNEDPTKSATGETWYKVIAYTDDPEEAKKICSQVDDINFRCFFANLYK